MSDDIDALPVDKSTALNPNEAARVSPYIKPASSAAAAAGDCPADTFLGVHYRYIWIAAGFLVLSLPFLDSLLTTFTGNRYWTLLVKTILFIIFVIVVLKMT